MLQTLSSIPAIWLTGGSFFALLVAVAMGTMSVVRAISAEREHRTKSALMPAYHDLEAARASLQETRRQITEETDRLGEVRRQIAESERERVDAKHWQTLVDEAKREYEGLTDKLREIDKVRDQFEEAAKDLAARRQEVADAVTDRERLLGEVERLSRQKDEVENLEKQIQEKESRLVALREEMASLGNRIEELRQARFEVEQLERRKAQLEEEIEELPEQVEDLKGEKRDLEKETAKLREDAARLRMLRDTIDRLTARKAELEAAVEMRTSQKEDLVKEIDRLKEERGAVSESGSSGTAPVKDSKLFEDLLRAPSCLFDGEERVLPVPNDQMDEVEAIGRVEQHLRSLGLDFDSRIIKRFHTCLKTSHISPLTVLAGISGTGKSLLPQRYAEAMGIHFLKLAVQPRWDSPQDLLGFYNYLEKSYKATDLARALVRMDEHSDLVNAEGSACDRVLMVLLDEMNLARVEYYFSEFLSRLEGRPEAGVDDEERLRPGRIEIDIPGETHKLLSIYAGHNVLFTGTMNEDESTQALSDKVLDRANMIRFPRPKKLVIKTAQGKGKPSDGYLPFETWNAWHRGLEALDSSKQAFVGKFVNELNNHLAELKRPFAHRITQAIFSYAANHPDYKTDRGVREALADMLEMRILPKLRGVELQNREKAALQKIRGLIDSELQDEHKQLSRRIGENMQGADMFTWTGA